jgi:hypothetical protein
MKKSGILFMLAIFLAGGALGMVYTPSQAQVYAPPPPPSHPQYAAGTPWVGPNTPWVYYNGDWFLNGILYYFFGNRYGWAPYYAYPPTYIVRPGQWYAPRWQEWYRGHPVYWQNFQRYYPYWRGHHEGMRYGQDFYNRYHHGQGGGWQRGYHGESGERGGHGGRGGHGEPGEHR